MSFQKKIHYLSLYFTVFYFFDIRHKNFQLKLCASFLFILFLLFVLHNTHIDLHSYLESYRLKWPLRSSSPVISPSTPSSRPDHLPHCPICTSSKYLQGWCLSRFPGQPLPVADTLLVKKPFLVAILNLFWGKVRPFSLVLMLITWDKRLTLTSL